MERDDPGKRDYVAEGVHWLYPRLRYPNYVAAEGTYGTLAKSAGFFDAENEATPFFHFSFAAVEFRPKSRGHSADFIHHNRYVANARARSTTPLH